ncbi:GOLPH3/VPS74 family protein [Luteipulveratus mongoliensis]|uniref:GOLPH3/VPS74 family protein n=1 Tax=Luteipulveratus mongoliensis TaxID=571913 RepID=UPI00247FC1DF|nr:GPP34 family phosphoprotein [Luteipulveratus mongoliensis]
MLQREGDRPKDVLDRVAKGLRNRTYRELAVQGFVREEPYKFFGLIPKADWPVLNPAEQQATRDVLARVLIGSTPPDARTGALIALIHAVEAMPAVFAERVGLSKGDIKRRARAIADGSWPGSWACEATNRAVADRQTAF